jgi:hypothetical protein
MMLDGERVVHQGLGWFLREAWKRDAATVEPFLLEFKDTAARLIFQYATERMTAGDKARFKADKATTAGKAGKAGAANGERAAAVGRAGKAAVAGKVGSVGKARTAAKVGKARTAAKARG